MTKPNQWAEAVEEARQILKNFEGSEFFKDRLGIGCKAVCLAVLERADEIEVWKSRATINGQRGFEFQEELAAVKSNYERAKQIMLLQGAGQLQAEEIGRLRAGLVMARQGMFNNNAIEREQIMKYIEALLTGVEQK